MSDAVRDFLVRTILQDDAGKGLDALIAKATSLTEKAYTMTVQVATKEAEKAVASLEKAATKASKVDSSKATKGHKDQAEAAKGLADKLKTLTEQSEKAGDTASSFFTKLDAGRLVVAGAAAGMIAYAKSALQTAEAQRLNIDMIKDQLGAQTSLTSFIAQGGQTSGTSKQGRGDLMALMAMTGYKDENEMKKAAENAEKIMSSTFGQQLAKFGVNNEEELLKVLSGPMDENSDIGRVVKSKFPEMFKAGTLATEKIKVQSESKFAFQSDAVVEAEARRRLASKALEKMSSGVVKDKDSYRVAAKDFSTTFSDLSQSIGDTVRPAALMITQLMTSIMKLVNIAPEIPILITVVLGLGVAFSTLGSVLPLVTSSITKMSASLLANPIGLAVIAVVALVVILSSLEKRFGLFTKAWEKFSNSEIGKDIIATVKAILDYFGLLGEGDFLSGLGAGIMKVAGFIGNLFDQFDAIYKMVKGGDIAGALKGGLALALKISPVGMTASFVEALRPGKRVQDMILYVLQKMKDLWDGFTRWLTGIWEVVDKLLEPILKLKEYLQGVYEKMFGGEGKSGSALTTAVSEEIKKNPAFAGLSEAQQEYLARTASGEKYWKNDETGEYKYGATSPGEGWRDYTAEGSTQISMGEAIGISSNLIDEAKKIADNLKNPKGMLNGGVSTSGAASSAVSGARKSLEEDTAERAKKTQENLDKGLSGTAAADWSAATPFVAMGKAAYGGLVGLYDYLTVNDVGGDVTKSGIAWVDEGEPIVPAEVARSSTLINSLKDIASSGGSGSNGGPVSLQVGEVHVHVEGQGANAYDIAREVAKEVRAALEKELDDFTFGQKVERAVHRMNRAYTG